MHCSDTVVLILGAARFENASTIWVEDKGRLRFEGMFRIRIHISENVNRIADKIFQKSIKTI